ncbi:MAG: Cysteine synthase, CysO-dependent, partial [uncultured Nocardioides sp.]
DAVRRPAGLGRQHPAGRPAPALAEPGGPHLGQARGPQPDRLHQGPPGAADDRAGRGRRHPAAGVHDPRADLGQHRDLPGDGRQAQGLPHRVRDAGEHLGGASAAAADVGRGDHLLARRRWLQRGRPRRQAGRRGPPRLGDALPVRQRGQRPRARGGNRPRDPGRPADHHPLRRRARHDRDPDGRLPLLPRPQAGRPDRGRRAALRRARLRPPQPRRGVRPGALRRVADRLTVQRRPARRRTAGARAAGARGHLRRHLDRGDPPRRPRPGRQGGQGGGVCRHRLRGVRRRLEVPLHGCLRGHRRRGRGPARRPALGL